MLLCVFVNMFVNMVHVEHVERYYYYYSFCRCFKNCDIHEFENYLFKAEEEAGVNTTNTELLEYSHLFRLFALAHSANKWVFKDTNENI